MAMRSCRECGQKVSSEAKVCPGCGVKKPYQTPVRGFIFLGIIAIAIYKGCSGGGSENTGNSYYSNDVASNDAPTSQPFVAPEAVKVKKAASVNLMPASTTPFTQSQVCRAAIAGMFGKNVGKTQVAKTKTAGVFNVSYIRPSDNQRFSFDCKLSDDNVIWKESGQSSNRWRGTGNVEFNVVFMVRDDELTVKELHADSVDVTYKFSKKDFR